jgi:hypothetical protein
LIIKRRGTVIYWFEANVESPSLLSWPRFWWRLILKTLLYCFRWLARPCWIWT